MNKITDLRRAKFILLSKLFKSQKEFSKAINSTPGYINQLMSGHRSIGEKAARKIEIACNKPVGWLDFDNTESSTNEHALPVPVLMSGNTATIEDTARKVPLISWVSAGLWCEAIDNYSPGDAEAWLPCPVKCGHNAFALRVSGDSMTSLNAGAKTYPDGCIIYVDPGIQLTNGCRVVAKLMDQVEVTFKTYREDAGKKWLIPINPQYEKILVDKNIVICGVVVAKFEPE